MFNVQLTLIPYLPGSMKMANYGLSSEDALEPLTVVIYTSPPPAPLQSLYRNRKGFLSQNCLFICNFDMLFTYILSGWEGSATDARVWTDALAKGFSVPEGFYYLADAGYPHCKELLVPFRGVRYHLQEWGAAGVRYVFSLMDLIFC
jgi:hypothetical protein